MQTAFAYAVARCIEDGDGCQDPASCNHEINRMTPAEFAAWLKLYLAPPEQDRELRAMGAPPSQDRRARWARKMRAAGAMR